MAQIGWVRPRGRHRRGGFGANRTLETSWPAVFKFRCLRPAGAILALGGHFLIIVKLEDRDVRASRIGMDPVMPS